METVDISPGLLIVFALFAAFAHGFSGFGFGILLMVFLSFAGAGLERASVLVTLLAFGVTLWILFGARREFRVDWAAVGRLFLGTLAGLPLGYWFVCRYGQAPAGRIVFGGVLVLFAIQGLWKPNFRVAIPDWLSVGVGAVGGFLGGAFSTSGPPFVYYLYFRERDPRVAKRTIQVIFAFLGIYRIFIIVFGPHGISGALLGTASWVAPVVVLGAWLGHRASRTASSAVFVRTVYVLLAFAGVTQWIRAFR